MKNPKKTWKVEKKNPKTQKQLLKTIENPKNKKKNQKWSKIPKFQKISKNIFFFLIQNFKIYLFSAKKKYPLHFSILGLRHSTRAL